MAQRNNNKRTRPSHASSTQQQQHHNQRPPPVSSEDADFERAMQLSMQDASSSSVSIQGQNSNQHADADDEQFARLLLKQFEEEDRLQRLKQTEQMHADQSLASALAGADTLRAEAETLQNMRANAMSPVHAKAQRNGDFNQNNVVLTKDVRKTTTTSTTAGSTGVSADKLSHRPVYNNVFIAESRRIRRLWDLGGDAGQVLLPEDTAVKREENYQQWTLPPPQKARPDIVLKKVAELDDVPRQLFKESGVDELNPVQSVVYDVAWGKPFENMLVCAPTGSGKTNIALTCIARVLHDQQVSLRSVPLEQRTRNNKYKIVYLAPMKALAHEICSKFRQALRGFNCNVKEMTGDAQLSQKEKTTTNVIIATPEKWDVIMRQGSSNLLDELKLLIIDEIHLINEDRGPVLEALIARTIRQIEVEQRIVRLVGLSATLPNYDDVGTFLRVNLNVGLFFFDDRFRPVPLTQSFVGIVKNAAYAQNDKQSSERQKLDVLFDILCDELEAGRQVIIFVHSRRGTALTARAMLQLAAERGQTELFKAPILHDDAAFKHTLACRAQNASAMSQLKRQLEQIEDRDLQEFIKGGGLGGVIVHHAGLPKNDRRIVERAYLLGAFPVLVSTATLAWGVNLPADTIIIFGTKVYDQRTGKMTDIDALDIQQMFGRAGRPQFKAQGQGIIITPIDEVSRFMRLMNNEQQIESRLAEHLSDHLNAEVALNNINSVGEAISWLRETYMYLHMLRNPMQYGIAAVGRRPTTAGPSNASGGGGLFDEGGLIIAIQERLEDLVRTSAVQLQDAGMIKFLAQTGTLKSTIIGKIASRYYVACETMKEFVKLDNATDLEHVLNVVCGANEFTRMIERPDEVEELDYMLDRQTRWRVPGTEHAFQRKTNILLQAYFNGYYPKKSSTLLLDQRYAVEETPRLARAVMSMGLALNAPWLTLNGYTLASMIEHGMWPEDFALLQMRDTSIPYLSQQKIRREVAQNLMKHRDAQNIDMLRSLDVNTVAAMGKCQTREARMVLDFAQRFPLVEVDTLASHIRPVTCTAGKLELHLQPKFLYDPKYHGGVSLHHRAKPQPSAAGGGKPPAVAAGMPTGLKFHIMIVCGDEADAIIVAHQEWGMTTADFDPKTNEPRKHVLELFVPIAEHATRSVVAYVVYVFADTWFVPQWYLGEPVNFDRRNIPAEDRTIDLHALLSPVSVHAVDEMPLPDNVPMCLSRRISVTSKEREYSLSLYRERLAAHTPLIAEPSKFFGNFEFFNAVQSHVFHCAYHSNTSIFLGAPTGSGKTLIAELCMLRLFQLDPTAKCVYIAPLKALVRERMNDWQPKMLQHLNIGVVELTGESQPDARVVRDANIIVTTPEKWDGISRQWQSRQYVRRVKLVIIDEIHMIGQDRGPVLEVIVSRIRAMNTMLSRDIPAADNKSNNDDINSTCGIRIVGLSTPLTNARQLALWLGCKEQGIFNISSAYRPVRLEIHIDGFSQRAYCPRMNEMNIPTYRAIVEYGENKPVLVFVASRRQTRITARAMVSNSIIDGVARFRRGALDDAVLASLRHELTDRDLEQCLQHGVGYHNAGMTRRDREIVEHLFKTQQITVLVATATLAWGVNLPAHMVVVKGTEYFDGKTKKYVQFPVTDVIQMTGRAGRPQYDQSALAFVFVQDKFKDFYKTFLHSPFPVESSLKPVFGEHLNAEIVAGTVRSLYHACQYLYSTFLAYRLVSNPKYYGLETPEDEELAMEAEYVAAQAAHEEAQRQQKLKQQRILVPGMSSAASSQKPMVFKQRRIAPMQERIDLFIQRMAFDEASLLVQYRCAQMDENGNLEPTFLGSIASFYYLKPRTVDFFYSRLSACDGQNAADVSIAQLLMLLSEAPEFDDVPVRHNEDNENRSLAEKLHLFDADGGPQIALGDFANSHTKALLLLLAHVSGRVEHDDEVEDIFPSTDYRTDLRSVLEQLPRILQALLDISAELGLLVVTLKILLLTQMLVQGRWWSSDPLEMLGVRNKLIQSRIRNSILGSSSKISNKISSSGDCSKRQNAILPELVYTLRSDAELTRRIVSSVQSLNLTAVEWSTIFEMPLRLPVLHVSSMRVSAVALQQQSDAAITTIFYCDVKLCAGDNARRQSAEKNSGPVSKGSAFAAAQSNGISSKVDDNDNVIRLYSDVEYSLELRIDRAGIPPLSGKNLAPYVSSYYQKARDETWRVIVGCPTTSTLFAVTNYQPKTRSGLPEQLISLKFTIPGDQQRGRQQLIWLSCFLISEQFMGLDLQFDIPVEAHARDTANLSSVCPFVDESNVYKSEVQSSVGAAAGEPGVVDAGINLERYSRLSKADGQNSAASAAGDASKQKNKSKTPIMKENVEMNPPSALSQRDLDFEPEVYYVKSNGKLANNSGESSGPAVLRTKADKEAARFKEIWKDAADPEKLYELKSEIGVISFDAVQEAQMSSTVKQATMSEITGDGGSADAVSANGSNIPWYKANKPTAAAAVTSTVVEEKVSSAVSHKKDDNVVRTKSSQPVAAVMEIPDDDETLEESSNPPEQVAEKKVGAWWKK